jgi:hypothetical protein
LPEFHLCKVVFLNVMFMPRKLKPRSSFGDGSCELGNGHLKLYRRHSLRIPCLVYFV